LTIRLQKIQKKGGSKSCIAGGGKEDFRGLCGKLRLKDLDTGL